MCTGCIRFNPIGDESSPSTLPRIFVAVVIHFVEYLQHRFDGQVCDAVTAAEDDVDVTGHPLAQAWFQIDDVDFRVEGDDRRALFLSTYRCDPANKAGEGRVWIGIDNDVHFLPCLQFADVDFGNISAHNHLTRVADFE